jgi:uncharacterized membrane protein
MGVRTCIGDYGKGDTLLLSRFEKRNRIMWVYILAAVFLLCGMHLFILAFKKPTPKDKLQKLHQPPTSYNINGLYISLGVSLIIFSLILIFK